MKVEVCNLDIPMEKMELKKRLEKKKAYFFCLMLFLALVTPTLLSYCRQANTSVQFQWSVVAGIVMIIFGVYKKMNRIRAQIKTIFR